MSKVRLYRRYRQDWNRTLASEHRGSSQSIRESYHALTTVQNESVQREIQAVGCHSSISVE